MSVDGVDVGSIWTTFDCVGGNEWVEDRMGALYIGCVVCVSGVAC
jgi:hypothetical protein